MIAGLWHCHLIASKYSRVCIHVYFGKRTYTVEPSPLHLQVIFPSTSLVILPANRKFGGQIESSQNSLN